jgi:enoyl-CoA hydratase
MRCHADSGGPALSSKTSLMRTMGQADPTVPAARYERLGTAAWIRLERPERMNAITPEVIAGIISGLERAQLENARAVVITGSGGVFCAGADLKGVLGKLDDLASVESLLEDANNMLRKIEEHPSPVIAAINGLTIAGGLEIVLACDLAVASEDAKLADGHATYGLFPGGGSATRLTRIVGPIRAKTLLFTGLAVSAAEMHTMGVVGRVVPAEELELAVQNLCEVLSRRSADSLRRMKLSVRASLGLCLDDALALELSHCREHLRSRDVAEGLAAFNAGRRPDFS